MANINTAYIFTIDSFVGQKYTLPVIMTHCAYFSPLVNIYYVGDVLSLYYTVESVFTLRNMEPCTRANTHAEGGMIHNQRQRAVVFSIGYVTSNTKECMKQCQYH